MNKVDESNKPKKQSEKRVSQKLDYNNLSKKRESLLVQKGRDFFKNKKAVSMRHIYNENEKINININHNINISANINEIKEQNSEDYSQMKPKTSEIHAKIVKFENYIEKEKSKEYNNTNKNNDNKIKEKEIKNIISKEKAKDLGSSRLDKNALKQLKFEAKEEKQDQQ